LKENSMGIKPLNYEKGQAIVYLVLGLVVFLGFVALAIDGGMVLADRRHEQNAADAASLAGGGKIAINLTKANITSGNWSCSSAQNAMNSGETAAIQRALDNSFTILDKYPSACDDNCVIATCSDSGQYIDVTVKITAVTQSNFLQIVYPSALTNKVQSVTRVYPGGPLGWGNAIVALNPDSCSGASKSGAGFRGNSNTNVMGGGIFSNGCITGGGSAEVNVEEPYDISYNDFFGDPANFTPTPVDVSPAQIPSYAYDVPLPDCTKTPHNVASLPTYPPAMQPGLWCITGDLKIKATDEIHGDGVTIYIPNGYLDIAGGAKLELSAPGQNASPAIPGMLFYLPPSNSNSVTINGNSSLFSLTGTILAPSSHIKIDGSSSNTLFDSQIIGWDVELIGTATFDITYKGSENASLPTSMELYK
jgi:hypothetical protein